LGKSPYELFVPGINISIDRLVYRRKRKASKPGPSPYEYQVHPLLFDELEREQLEKLEELSK
jgi:hypothetical protein